MSDTLLIIAGLFLITTPVLLLALIVQALRKKPTKRLIILAMISLLLFIAFEAAGIALSCKHNFTVVDEISPTCVSEGTKFLFCDKCSKEKEESIPALEHQLIESTRVEPSVTKEGSITYVCTRCDYTEQTPLKKIPLTVCPHTWTSATCTTAKSCKDCNQTDGSPLGHDMIVSEQIEPTYTTPGETTFYCSRCGEEKSESIPMLVCSHDWEESANQTACVLCGETIITNAPDPTNEPASPDNKSEEDVDTSLISLRYERNYVDEDRLHLTVFTKNNSEEIFSGNIYVEFYSFDRENKLGSDTIFVEDLSPGRESWVDITIKDYQGSPSMTTFFSEVTFTPINKTSASVDSNATEQIKNSYYWGFYDVSWYNDITDIVVYSDGSCVVTVTDNTKNPATFYASVIWGSGNDLGVETVEVVNKSGTTLAYYP